MDSVVCAILQRPGHAAHRVQGIDALDLQLVLTVFELHHCWVFYWFLRKFLLSMLWCLTKQNFFIRNIFVDFLSTLQKELSFLIDKYCFSNL